MEPFLPDGEIKDFQTYKMKEMKTAYLSSAYLAPVEYYTKLLAYDKVFVEQHDHYIKQTYRNRCTIAGPSGELALSIPTVKPEIGRAHV